MTTRNQYSMTRRPRTPWNVDLEIDVDQVGASADPFATGEHRTRWQWSGYAHHSAEATRLALADFYGPGHDAELVRKHPGVAVRAVIQVGA